MTSSTSIILKQNNRVLFSLLKKSPHLLFASLYSFTLPLPGSIAFAADDTPENPVSQQEPGTQIIISAGRKAQAAKDILAPSTLLTREELEQKQYTSVEQALRSIPGLHISNSGGLGKQTSVFLRGTNSSHVLVLVDGIRIGAATAGVAAFEQYPIEQIDRIEVIRGPVSALYGSEAIGGIIHIFTRSGTQLFQDKSTSNLRLAVGTFNTQKASVGHSVKKGNHQLSAQVSQVDSDGFDSCRADAAGVGGCFNDEPDQDGFKNRSQSVTYRFDHKAGINFRLNAFNSENDTDFDGDFANFAKNQQTSIGARLQLQFSDMHQLEFAGGGSQDRSDSYKTAFGASDLLSSRFKTDRDSASILYHVSFGSNNDTVFSLGMDSLTDSIDVSNSFAVTSRTTNGGFAQLQGNYDKASFQANVRNDDNSQYGSYDSWNFRTGYFITPNLKLSVGHGLGFKAPTFNDLYFPGFSNPNLEVERSETSEVGAQGSTSYFNWSSSLFFSELRDLIVFDFATSAPQNIARSKIQGFEGSADFDFFKWEVVTQYTFLETENKSVGQEGNWLARRPRHAFTVDASRRLGNALVGMQWHLQGKRYDNPGNTNLLRGYGLLDLRAEFTLPHEWLLTAKLENLGGKEYETVRFYQQPDTMVMLGVEYRPRS